MPWYISEPEETGWRLDPNFLVTRLQEQWPNAKITKIIDPGRQKFSHEWKMRITDRVLDGKFNQHDCGVILDGDLKDAVAFALWFRSLVPSSQKLLFFDEAYLMHVDLRPETTESDITAAAGL